MGISPWYDVWCDEEGCGDWTTGGATRADAAKAGKAAGWQLKNGWWKCPAHKTAPVPRPHRHVRRLFAGNGQAYYYCTENECDWREEYHHG